MSEPMPESVMLDVRNGLGWNPNDPVRVLLEPGFSGRLAQIARDLVRQQIVEDLRLARTDLEATTEHQRDLTSRVARLEQALAEMEGEP